MDIQRAVNVCREEGNEKILLFQCTSLYPAPANLSNLRAINTMRDAFNLVTGYSDHTLGDNISIVAVAMGASAIEKHFTLDRNLSGPDHAFAIQPDELKVMVRKIREAEKAFGDGSKSGPREEEMDMYYKARRSLHAASDIKEGMIINESMLVSKRPGLGIPIHLKRIVIGRVARRDLKKDQWIDWSCI
jgi:sialic acid synthase SpsE